MQIQDKIAGNILVITIEGHITGISEVTNIKSVIQSNADFKIIELIIKDAYVIPSMLIGLLIKEVNQNKKTVKLKCLQKELKQLLSDLNLDSVLQVS